MSLKKLPFNLGDSKIKQLTKTTNKNAISTYRLTTVPLEGGIAHLIKGSILK